MDRYSMKHNFSEIGIFLNSLSKRSENSRIISMNKPVRKAISFSYRNNSKKVLLVKRPEEDEDLPNAWGLPAGSLNEGESWKNALRRSGIEKIGIEIIPKGVIAEGYLERDDYILHMREYEVEGKGVPVAKQEHSDITQYVDVKFVSDSKAIEYLKLTASQGSMCCMLFLYDQGVIDEEWMEEHNAELVK